jgi:RNA polymerase sigma-70 factor (ECF subfamily)
MFGSIAPGHFRHLYVRANGGPALAFYRPASPGAPHALHAIQLITTRDGAIATIDHFMLPELFALFAVPRELPAD